MHGAGLGHERTGVDREPVAVDGRAPRRRRVRPGVAAGAGRRGRAPAPRGRGRRLRGPAGVGGARRRRPPRSGRDARPVGVRPRLCRRRGDSLCDAPRRVAAAAGRAHRHRRQRVRRERTVPRAPRGRARLAPRAAARRRSGPHHRRAGRARPGHLPPGGEPARHRAARRGGVRHRHAAAARRRAGARPGTGAPRLRRLRRHLPQVAVRSAGRRLPRRRPGGAAGAARAPDAHADDGRGHAAVGVGRGARRRPGRSGHGRPRVVGRARPGRAGRRRLRPAGARRRRRLDGARGPGRADRHHHARDEAPVATRCALLEGGFVTSAVPTARSADLDRPVLRVSTAAWVEPADLDALAAALPGCTS